MKQILKINLLIVAIACATLVSAQAWDDPTSTNDWNQLWRSAFVQSANAANAPESSGWFWGLNMNHSYNHDGDATWPNGYRYNGQIAIKNANTVPTMYFRSTNRDGIGTWAKIVHEVNGKIPTKLDIGVSGDGAELLRFSTDRAWVFKQVGSGSDAQLALQAKAGGKHFKVQNHLGEDAFSIQDGGNSYFRGNMAIGTATTGTHKLAVNGSIHAEEVLIDLNVQGPDYVFEPSYDLRTLEETEEFITTNKHLPEVPSAKEMEENGIVLGEMNMLLLKKIEELTLHLIEQNSKIEKLEKQVSGLTSNK